MVSNSTATKPRVLLVDDVPANLTALSALLADLGCELVCASSGNEALKQLLRGDFAVMLLDVQMPQMDGYEVATYARENPATRDVPIIFLSAVQHGEHNVLRGYGTGAVDFLLKPLNAYVLRAKVRVFVELFLTRQQLAEELRAHEQTLETLRVINESLRQFTGAASHDLRAPLRAIQGFLQALTEDAWDKLDEGTRDYVTRALDAARRMQSLLESLLQYSRLQRPGDWRSVDCNVLVKQIRNHVGERLAAANVTLDVGELSAVVGDEGRLYQLFLNLITNAIKFHREEQPRTISMSADVKERETVFLIEDNGIGIDPAHQTAIFEPFKRLHSADKYDGSGLGLAICSQVVRQHGGRMWVESELGRGSRFYVALPHGAL